MEETNFQKIINSNNLDQFISISKARLQNILRRLQWSEKDILKNFNTNSGAYINEENIIETEKSIEKEQSLPLSSATNSIVIDQIELRRIVNDDSVQIPQRFSDLQLNFTREQKLNIYEYVVGCTGRYTEPEANVFVLNENCVSFAEIVAMKKKECKKRRKFRTSKPTHIEEIRGLVDLQMQALEQYLCKYNEETVNTKHSGKDSTVFNQSNITSYDDKRKTLKRNFEDVPRDQPDYYHNRHRSKSRVTKGEEHQSRRNESSHRNQRHESLNKYKCREYRDHRNHGRNHDYRNEKTEKYERKRSRNRSYSDTATKSNRKRSNSRDRSPRKKLKKHKHKRERSEFQKSP